MISVFSVTQVIYASIYKNKKIKILFLFFFLPYWLNLKKKNAYVLFCRIKHTSANKFVKFYDMWVLGIIKYKINFQVPIQLNFIPFQNSKYSIFTYTIFYQISMQMFKFCSKNIQIYTRESEIGNNQKDSLQILFSRRTNSSERKISCNTR